MAFPVPDRLARHSADRAGWLAALPDTVAALAARWSLTLGPPFEPGGECAWVAPAGADLVLKVGRVHDEARDEAAGLRAWDGRGAVRVLADHRDGETSALLLERAHPGTPLTRLPGPERDVVLTGLLRRLWIDPPAGHPFRPLSGCATPGRRRPASRTSTPASSATGWRCSGRCRGTTPRRRCSPRTCTRRTSSPPGASRGSRSTRNPTSVTRRST